MLRLGQEESKSSRIPSDGSYDAVALEYYDQKLHPTCADFRDATRVALTRLFNEENPKGRIGDVGCGLSLVKEFVGSNLVLIDASQKMLEKNTEVAERRMFDVEQAPFANSEFDWLFALLADPFNTRSAWENIGRSLKVGGKCYFVVPSYSWVKKFRDNSEAEREGYARFETADKSEVFLPSFVYSPVEQVSLIASVGLHVLKFEQIARSDLVEVRSSKIQDYLSADDAVLDTFLVRRLAQETMQPAL